MSRSLILSLTILAALLCGCASVSRLLSDGKVDKAYERALERLTRAHQRGKLPSDRRVDDYLLAFEHVQRRDRRHVEALRARGGDGVQAQLFEGYRQLHTRSVDLLALAPAVAADMLSAELRPARLASARDAAARRAAAYCSARAAPLLPAARIGDRPAARRAFALYDSVAYFLPERAAALGPLLDSLYDLATLRIHVRAAPRPFDAADEIGRSLARLGTRRRGWTELAADPGGARVDLRAEVRFDDHDATGPDESCSSTTYTEEVLDYVERKTVREQVDDSTVVERVIEIEHFKEISATVTECEVELDVRAEGHVAVYAPGAARPSVRLPIASTQSWSDEYTVVEGDADAVPSGISCSGISTCAPSRWALLADAQAELADEAYRALARRYPGE